VASKSVSVRVLILIALSLAIGVGTAGLFKAALESVLPGPKWLQKLTRFEVVPTVTETPGGATGTTYEYDLGRASRRFLLLATLAVFIGLRRWIPWKKLSRGGFRRENRGRLVAYGALLGCGLFLTYFAIVVSAGGLVWGPAPVSYLLRKIPQYAIGALAIAFLEELFFRGVVFRSMLRDWGMKTGLVVSSGVFAVLHCISGGQRVTPGWDPLIGARLFKAYFTDSSGSFLPDLRLMVGLFLLALLLSFLFLKTGSLWASVGFHAAVVFTSKIQKQLFVRTSDFPQWLFGDRVFIISGLLCWILIPIALFVALKTAPEGSLWRRILRRRGAAPTARVRSL